MAGVRGPKPPEITLSEAERDQLQSWSRRWTTAAGLATCSRLVLVAAEGKSNSAIATDLKVSRPTVTTWRARFAEHRLEGLADEPRPGRPRSVTDAHVENLIVTTLETTPKNATHWSTRSMAEHLGLSQTTVSRTWRAFGLKPHLQDRFTMSTDPFFIDKLHDVDV
jgi:transposase